MSEQMRGWEFSFFLSFFFFLFVLFSLPALTEKKEYAWIVLGLKLNEPKTTHVL